MSSESRNFLHMYSSMVQEWEKRNASGHFILRLSIASVQFLFNSRGLPHMRLIAALLWYGLTLGSLFESENTFHTFQVVYRTQLIVISENFIYGFMNWMKKLYFSWSLHYILFRLKWILLTVNHGTEKRWFVLSEDKVQNSRKAVQCTEGYSGEYKTDSPEEFIPLNPGRRPFYVTISKANLWNIVLIC
jgi:hypothetical protein